MVLKRSLAVLALVGLVFIGCAVKKGTINSYIEPTYNRGAIKTIAMFPVRNAKFAPSEVRQLNKELIQTMKKKNPSIEIVSPSKAQRLINESGLAREWANFIEDYYTSGIPDSVALKNISKALKVDAVFQGQLLNIRQNDGDGWTRKGQTRITVSFSIVETETAKIVWEATADGISITATES